MEEEGELTDLLPFRGGQGPWRPREAMHLSVPGGHGALVEAVTERTEEDAAARPGGRWGADDREEEDDSLGGGELGRWLMHACRG